MRKLIGTRAFLAVTAGLCIPAFAVAQTEIVFQPDVVLPNLQTQAEG